MSSLLEQLKSMIPTETIGGIDVEQCGRDVVMLDVEFTPVLPNRLENDPVLPNRLENDPQEGRLPECPTPCRVQQEGSRYCVWLPQNDPERYRWVNADDLRVMRARYILLKNWFFTNIEACDPLSRNTIISRFFPGGLFKPEVLKNDNGTPVYFGH